MKPKDRQLMYQAQVEQELAKRKQEDHGWEDLVDVRNFLTFLSSICVTAVSVESVSAGACSIPYKTFQVHSSVPSIISRGIRLGRRR